MSYIYIKLTHLHVNTPSRERDLIIYIIARFYRYSSRPRVDTGGV